MVVTESSKGKFYAGWISSAGRNWEIFVRPPASKIAWTMTIHHLVTQNR